MTDVVKIRDGLLTFKCPGCNLHHTLPVDGRPSAWRFNGSTDRPTLEPSILARGGCCYEPDWHDQERRRGIAEPCDKGCPDEDGISMCHTCHSFVRGGQIEFLSDCTHAMAGKTVPLPAVAP
ncbi:DUF6527 family protein [Stenotrophomonas maltophilia group sp. RNC7]|uniref:DUF6527 family protein n=1 Tax=Stenotrophomonas maltophilia group sp. RNC7 TaxID=3071467 RepID=UPI0027DF6852|nr:DUF6527 family protein [Stenotrophomonas maltophilia group sp. RNC7]MDQ4681435.1 DUF6527 family protein [Stenotrophomonas maltophilia group sp. RNC7]